MESIRKKISPMKPKTRLEEIGQLYFQDGYSFEQIYDILGISMKTIRRAFKKQNWAFRTSARTKQLDPDWIQHLYYIEGFSQQEIAESMDVHKDTIRKLFSEQGWIAHEVKESIAKDTRDLERSEYQIKRRSKLNEARVRIFGMKCYACHSKKKSTKNHHLHRKDGTGHDRNLFRSLKRLESLNPDEWAVLCDRCHLGIHTLMKVFGYDWKRIESFLESRKKTSDKAKETLKLPDDNAPVSKEFKALGRHYAGTFDDLKKGIFGTTCSLCGCQSEKKSLTLHRKDGKTHHPSMTKKKKYLPKLNPAEWALVCHNCHNVAQWALDKLGIEWPKLHDILGENGGGPDEI